MKKIILLMLFAFILIPLNTTNAYGECSGYGINATYDYLSGGCKCRSGYVWGEDFLGKTACVSCSQKYGIYADYSYLDDKCICEGAWDTNFLGESTCVSCSQKYGLYSSYDSLKDSCKCTNGYVLTKNTLGSLTCTDGDVLCHSQNGYNSSYNSSTGYCECDDGYTLNDNNQCVEKQNNVYFLLKELDTANNLAIIKSEYTSQNYLIKYSYGCYDSSIKRYLNGRIVVNLGTDFYVDAWDKIVLYNDNETCDISSVKTVSSAYSFVEVNNNSLIINNPEVINTPVTIYNTASLYQRPTTTVIIPSVINSYTGLYGRKVYTDRPDPMAIIGAMVKGETDPATYIIDTDGKLRWIKTEAVANRLFGSSWDSYITWFNDSIIYTYKFGEIIEQ